MFDKLKGNTALRLFAVITAVQACFAIVWIFGSGRGSWGLLVRLLLFVAVTLATAGVMKLHPLFTLYAATNPFVLLTLSEPFMSPAGGKSPVLIASVGFLGGLAYLWKGKRKLFFTLGLVVGAICFVLLEKYLVFEWQQPDGVRMSLSYLLYEKTCWPHVADYRFVLGSRGDALGQALDSADMDISYFRGTFAGMLKDSFGEDVSKFYRQAAAFAVSMGTREFLGSTVGRILLFAIAPFSFYIICFFMIPDTFVPQNILEFTDGAPIMAKWYLVFFFLGLMVLLSGAISRAIHEGRLKNEILRVLKLLAGLLAVGAFIYFFRTPCFDIRDGGLAGFILTAYLAGRTMNSTDGEGVGDL